MGYIVSHFIHILLMFQFCFMFCMEEGHPAVTKGMKMATFYGWKYRHYFVVAVTVIVILSKAKTPEVQKRLTLLLMQKQINMATFKQ